METFARVLILLLAFLGSVIPNAAIRTSSQGCPFSENTVDLDDTDSSSRNAFDVTKFGAVGDGKKDDVKAFQSAWDAACNAETESVTINAPSNKQFLVSQIRFQGPCKPKNINFMILGSIVSPPMAAYKNKLGANMWLCFYQVNGLVVDGNGKGVIDGQGSTWWNKASTRPTALFFQTCNNLQVRGLKHLNSQWNHVAIAKCNRVQLSNLQVIAPEDSPNTDGIKFGDSTNIRLQNSVIATGDDCVAILGGTSIININNIKCGPGHGISVGSLGKNGQHDEVQGITVSNCTFIRADNGVRIKTWPGGSGFAKNITFTHINFIETANPIIIDQFYCPGKGCANKTGAVQISNIKFVGFRGTSSSKDAAIKLKCSKRAPCVNIKLLDVDIQPASPAASNAAECINVLGDVDMKNSKINCRNE